MRGKWRGRWGSSALRTQYAVRSTQHHSVLSTQYSVRCSVSRKTSCVLFFLLLSGCMQKMAMQPSFKPLDPDPWFPNGASARPLPEGTVARGHLKTDRALFSGWRAGESPQWTRSMAVVGAAAGHPLAAVASAAAGESDTVDTFPFPVTEAVLRQGQNRFMIYCVVCHDPLGTGRGKIVERGYTPPPSYHIERLRKVPVGHFFNVITEGYGSMPDYRAQVPPRDRWAIAAYIRALQLSQHFPAKDLPEDLRRELEAGNRVTRVGGPPQ
jgi:mono/diheme cytochrome c family protein